MICEEVKFSKMWIKTANLKNHSKTIYTNQWQKTPQKQTKLLKKPQIAQKNQSISIGVIGTGEMFDEFKLGIESNNLAENVKVLGFKSNPLKMISNSKLMILTSYFEGTPMTALESMGLSVPIVSTKTDGMKVLIKDGVNGFLYDTDEEAVEMILNLVENEEELEKIKKTTLEFAKEYNDVNSYKSKLVEIYKIK